MDGAVEKIAKRLLAFWLICGAALASGLCGEVPMGSELEKLGAKLQWLNVSRPLNVGDFKGRVVLLDFWTYCCVNCLHVIPDLKRLEAKYGDDLLVVGVHCGKFSAEKDFENIRQAVLRNELRHPVANDPNFSVWQAFGAHSWPTLALLDANGFYQGSVSGEGNYETLDLAIGKLLAKRGAKGKTPLPLALELEKAESRGLSFPGKVLASSDGRVFISDSNHNRIVVASGEGELVSIVGSGRKGSSDGPFASASFFNPQGLALVGDKLLVADTGNHLLRCVDLGKGVVSTLAGTGEQGRLRSGGGPGLATPLNSPWDLCALPDGRVIVAMAGSHQLWSYDLAKGRIALFAGDGREGLADGGPERASFAQPSGLTANADASVVFVADSETSSVRAVSAADGRARTLVGEGLFDFGDRDGAGSEARLQHPLGVAFYEGLVYVADSYNGKLKTIDPATRESATLAIEGLRLSEPGGLSAVKGLLYVADSNQHRIVKVDLKRGRAEPFAIKGLSAPADAGDGPQFCPLPPKAK